MTPVSLVTSVERETTLETCAAPELPLPDINLDLSRYEYAVQTFDRLVPSLPSRVAFDIGAGSGRLKRGLTASGALWMGFDAYPASPEILPWDLADPCPTQGTQAGIAFLLDVVEHLANPTLGLQRVADVVAPNGCLLLTTPNPLWSKSRIHAMLRGVPACFTQADLNVNGHIFTPWPHILAKMLGDAGFRIEEYVTLDGMTTWPRRPLTIRYPVRVAGAILCKVIERLDSAACGMSYGLVARKRA